MKKLLLFLCSSSILCAGTVRLYNDSPYKLRAVIRGADGSYLGEMIVLPEHFNTWSDQYPGFGPGGQNYATDPNRTTTPYSVQWFCLDGSGFGFCSNVPTGGAVMAESCEGPRICTPPKQQKKSFGPHEDDEQLYNQNEAQSSNNSSTGQS